MPQRTLLHGALEMLILETLRRQPLHGYALAYEIKRQSRGLIAIDSGSLYPALRRMVTGKWIEADWTVSTKTRRVRRYRITASGRRRLHHKVSTFRRIAAGVALVMTRST